jgi:hypothetical protein
MQTLDTHVVDAEETHTDTLATLVGSEEAVNRLVEEKVDTVQMPSAVGAIVLTITLHC